MLSYMCSPVSVCVTYVLQFSYGDRGQLVGLVLSFYQLGPVAPTQVIRLGSKHFYPLNSSH